jgi:hypothetical protein
MPRRVLCIISKKKNYKLGDIITFRGNDKRIYSHRIISIDDIKITTKGDNREKSEDYETNIPLKNILGKVIWYYPRGIKIAK